MLIRSMAVLTLFAVCVALHATEQNTAGKAPLTPHPVVKSFFVEGIQSDADVSKCVAAIKKLPSVTDVKEMTPKSGYVRVAFDTHVIASHLIAQTLRDNGADSVYITFAVPDYAKNAGKLDPLFVKIGKERFVSIEAQDKAKGQFKLTYLPIKPDQSDLRKVGFNYGHLGHPVHDPAPKGLTLAIQIQDVPMPGAAAKAKNKTTK